MTSMRDRLQQMVLDETNLEFSRRLFRLGTQDDWDECFEGVVEEIKRELGNIERLVKGIRRTSKVEL